MDLVYTNERVLKVISIVISALAWVIILYATKGLVLAYVLLFGLFYLFAQSALIAHIKGTGVRVSHDQYPDIYERFQKCCLNLELDPEPDCCVLRTNTFNAFATRFLGRNFVALFADVLDALKDNPASLNFHIGHELGHLQRKHLAWKPLLLPSSFLPLLGAAYHRACEYTCDRHGLACSESPTAAQQGLLARTQGYAIKCPGAARDIGDCMNKATAVCGGKYQILDRDGNVSGGAASPVGNSTVFVQGAHRTMIVSCQHQ